MESSSGVWKLLIWNGVDLPESWGRSGHPCSGRGGDREWEWEEGWLEGTLLKFGLIIIFINTAAFSTRPIYYARHIKCVGYSHSDIFFFDSEHEASRQMKNNRCWFFFPPFFSLLLSKEIIHA